MMWAPQQLTTVYAKRQKMRQLIRDINHVNRVLKEINSGIYTKLSTNADTLLELHLAKLQQELVDLARELPPE